MFRGDNRSASPRQRAPVDAASLTVSGGGLLGHRDQQVEQQMQEEIKTLKTEMIDVPNATGPAPDDSSPPTQSYPGERRLFGSVLTRGSSLDSLLIAHESSASGGHASSTARLRESSPLFAASPSVTFAMDQSEEKSQGRGVITNSNMEALVALFLETDGHNWRTSKNWSVTPTSELSLSFTASPVLSDI